MSYKINIKTPNKKEMGEILKAIGEHIKTATNRTVTVDLTVTFNQDDEEKANQLKRDREKKKMLEKIQGENNDTKKV